MATPKLHPCPFCGTDGRFVNSCRGTVALCPNLQCTAQPCVFPPFGEHWDEERAAKEWNKRANYNPVMKEAIMDAVFVRMERDDMDTPCTYDPANGKDFMTSSEHGVCDGDGFPVSDETIASALSAVAKIQAAYGMMQEDGWWEKMRKGAKP